MENFIVPKKEEVSEKNQQLFVNLNKALGFVPNLYAIMAYSEHGLARYLTFQSGKTSLNNKEKEAVNLIVSQINQCKYCLSAHTVLGIMNGFNEDEILKIRSGSSSNDKLNSLVHLTIELTQNKGRVSEDTLNHFYQNGYTNENLIDVILQISDKIAMNYLHNLTQIEIDFAIAEEI